MGLQIFINAVREFGSDSGDSPGNFLRGGAAESSDGAEFLKNGVFACFPDSFDVIQNGVLDEFQAEAPVVGDGEAVRFVADGLEQFESTPVMGEDQCFGAARNKNLLLFLGQSDYGEGGELISTSAFKVELS